MNAKQKEIGRYVVPSVASLLVTFLYIVVDGIFVGRGVGADALAAVNIALPFAALITSLADLIAMGGASVAAIRLGRDDTRGASQTASTALLLAIAASAVLCGVGMLYPDAIAAASGANARLLAPTTEYLFYYSAFVIFVVLSICLSAFVRNDGRPGLAFWGMIAGAAANVFLDWLFIFPFGMGLKGAAIASGIGQVLTVAIYMPHFLGGKGRIRLRPLRPPFALAAKIIARGVPEFITQMGQPITVLCFNYAIMRQLGELGVAAYAVICYITSLMFAILIGVAGGMQPLLGRSYGEKNREGLRYFLRAGMLINITASFALYVATVLGGDWVVGIFNSDPALSEIVRDGLAVYGFAFVLASISIMGTAFFFSTKRTGWAMLIAVARGCSLNILFIFLTPAAAGGDAIWFAPCLAELLTAALCLFLLWKSKNRHTSESVVLFRNSTA